MDFDLNHWDGTVNGTLNIGQWRNGVGMVESLWACDASLGEDLNAYLAQAGKRSPGLRYSTLEVPSSFYHARRCLCDDAVVICCRHDRGCFRFAIDACGGECRRSSTVEGMTPPLQPPSPPLPA